MTYRKHLTEDSYRMVLVYDDGREQEVSNDQDLLQQWLAAGNTPEVIPYIPPPAEDTSPSADDIKRMVLENTYLEATKNLILLSGGTVPDNTWPKLEDTEFANISLQAATNSPAVATVLLATLNYTFFQLKLIGWAWENIERREIPV